MGEKRSEQAKVFRQKIEGKIDAFVKISVTLDRDKPTEDGSIRDHKIEFDNRCIHLEPMNQYERSVVHDTAEIAGLVAHSFGQEDIDRHVVIWKKEFTPCEEEFKVAKKAEANSDRSFGMVSAESKKDRRTVEQVQAEIRAKKRANTASMNDDGIKKSREACSNNEDSE